MPNSLRLLFLMLLLALPVVANGQNLTATVADGRDADRAAIRAHIESICQAFIDGDVDKIRATRSAWIERRDSDGISSTGGTGLTPRDVTPEALEPLISKTIPGFGELFRWLSYEEIGTSTLQSRAFAGLANATFLFALPGSTSACRTAWEKLIRAQLDSRTRPCNLANLKPRLREG